MTVTANPERQPSEDPGTTSSTPRRPIFQTETTGDYWSDVREAFKVRRRSLDRPPRALHNRLSLSLSYALTDTMVH